MDLFSPKYYFLILLNGAPLLVQMALCQRRAPIGSDSCAAGRGRNISSPESLRFCSQPLGGFTPGPRPLRGLRPRTPRYFLYGQKVTKKTHRGGTLSMGSRPYVPHPRDDTKGATPPLDSPAGPLLVLLSFRYSRGCVVRTMLRLAPLETCIPFTGPEAEVSLIDPL